MKKELKKFISHILKSKLLLLGFSIYFLFNVSALTNHFMDFFFFGSSIHHCCQGLDFYQIPNGAYAFIHGGKLDGTLPYGIIQYSQKYVTNYNVYHPLLTIALGSIFILFNPEISIRIWIIVKILITLGATFYIYRKFHDNKYLNFALFIFLINFSQYNDIRISQYQFLFNIFILFLLINLAKNKNELEGGVFYFLSLIAKPVSLLFIPVLIIKKKWRLLISGILLFTVSTLTFKFLNEGDYYINNVTYHLFSTIPKRGIDFMSLDALLRSISPLASKIIIVLKFSFLIIIYLLAFNKRFHILISIFLLAVYFLLFYDNLFQYHFSILGPVLAICVLVVSQFQNKINRFLILLISLPNIFFLLRIFNFEYKFDPIYGSNPTQFGWQIVSFFQLLPIIILSFSVIIIYFKEYFNFQHE